MNRKQVHHCTKDIVSSNVGSLEYRKRAGVELCLRCGTWGGCSCLDNIGHHIEKAPNIEEQEMDAYNGMKKAYGVKWSHECPSKHPNIDAVEFMKGNQGF
tara:strand:- start:354 stop:653 length:300 start_codon:yes stop_codon:yes gene_type:complete